MEINFKKLNFLVEPKNYQNFWNNFLNWEQHDLNFVTEKGKQEKIFIDIGDVSYTHLKMPTTTYVESEKEKRR